MNDYLLIFSISPVQDFISQARKTKDLYAGSRLLSKLIKMQMEKISDQKDVKLIFPNSKSDSIPNRFVVKISNTTEIDIEEMADSLQENFKNSFIEIARNSFKGINQKFHFTQLEDFFSTNWAVVPIEKGYKYSYLKLEKLHAAVKNIRAFKQLGDGEGEQGRKCSLCGERNAYFYKSNDRRKPVFIDKKAIEIDTNDFKVNEALCTVCVTKRFYPNTSFPSTAEICLKGIIPKIEMDLFKDFDVDAQLFYKDNLNIDYLKKNQTGKPLKELESLQKQILKRCNLKDSNLPKYYAIIIFDGDNMGKLLSGNTLKANVELEDFHKLLAEVLSDNAKKAKEIVNKVGKTVYAGGDDFLGFCPLNKLLTTLKLLNETFAKEVNKKLQNYVKEEVTMSAGIAIAHYKTPLPSVLNWARKMEKTAKNEGTRNAFAIAVLKHSGEIHNTVWKWNSADNSNVENMEKIIGKLTEKLFSTNFIYTLEGEFEKLDNDRIVNKTYDKQFRTELKRLIHKSNISAKESDENELFEVCESFYNEVNKNIEQYFFLMRIVAFLARETGGEKC